MPDDRYSTITREVPVDRPRNTVFAATAGASGELNSQHRVSTHPAGFRVRERGAIDATVVHAYRCPVHGNFDARVPRSEVPDAVVCPVVVSRPRCATCSRPTATREDSLNDGLNPDDGDATDVLCWRHWYIGDQCDGVTSESTEPPCARPSPWAGSSCGIGHAAGEVTC